MACEEGYKDLKEDIEILKKKIPKEHLLSFNEKPEVKELRECFRKEPVIEHQQCMITFEIHPILDREIGKCISREEEQD